MNPFDLRGPEFLLFYIILAAVVFGALFLIRRTFESDIPPKVDVGDPCLIAYLRGGERETLQVALVSLIDRGLLIPNGTQIKRADNASPSSVRRPIEKALMETYAKPGMATSMLNDPKLKSVCQQYQDTLKTNRLLPDESVMRARWLCFTLAFFLLGLVGAGKIYIALERGRTNVQFLIILMIVAIVIAGKVSFPRLTARGTAMLKDLQSLYAGLKNRAASLRPGGATIEPMMLAAAFGVGALAGEGFAYTATLFPRPRGSSSGSSWGDSGSSGSSCGSSCGGGGCGGGCGGCGS